MVGGNNVIKKILKSEKGQSMVEFALVVPLLLTILCGIIDMGWAYSNKYSIESAAFSGVRYAVINGADIEDSEKNKLIDDTKKRVRDNLSKGAESPKIDVDIDNERLRSVWNVKLKCLHS